MSMGHEKRRKQRKKQRSERYLRAEGRVGGLKGEKMKLNTLVVVLILAILSLQSTLEWWYRASRATSGRYTKSWSTGVLTGNTLLNGIILTIIIIAIARWI